MAGEIDDGPQGFRHQHQPVAIATCGQRRQPGHQEDANAGAGELVVGHGGVAGVARQQDLLLALPRQHPVAIGERARSQGGIDHHLIFPLRQRLSQPMGQTESPATLVVGGHIGNGVWLLGQRVKMGLQLGQREGAAHRLRVTDQMQVVILEVHHPASIRPHYVSLPHVPLVRHGPVETLGAAGHFMDLQLGQAVLAPQGQRLSNPVPGQAAVERKQQGKQPMQLFTDLCLVIPVGGQITALG